MDVVSLLLQHVRMKGHDVWVGEPATEDAIAQLQAVIGVDIPPSLRTFLTNYGALGIADNFLSGIIDNEPLSTDAGGIYGDTLNLRESGDAPQSLWVICSHEDGSYCIDTSRPAQNGEFAIVNFEHGSQQHGVVLTESYLDFVQRWFLQGWDVEDA